MEKGLTNNGNLDIPIESKILLVYAQDGNGDKVITRIPRFGGLLVSAGGKNLTQNLTPSEGAKWQNAIDKLLEMGLIEDKGNKREVFGLTYTGFQMADELKDQLNIDTSKSPWEN